MRVAYTVEQCWHRVPGGTGVAALETATELMRIDDVELVGVAGTHDRQPVVPWVPSMPVRSLRGAGARLYASWLWLGRPRVERATGAVDVVHATSIIPCPSRAPLVVTVHDLAFLHDPGQFSRWGVAVFRRSLEIIRRRAALVLCSSPATLDDCARVGVDPTRLRHVPLGVRVAPPRPGAIEAARSALGLPAEYLVFVGTREPRKNLDGLISALDHLADPLPLVVVGPDGWGAESRPHRLVTVTGRLDDAVRDAVVAGAQALCYPSLREGFGLPVAEAMALGTPVVTSRGTATETTAGGAAVLVDPRSTDDIARGITEALARRDELIVAGHRRAGELTWAATAAATLACYREVAG